MSTEPENQAAPCARRECRFEPRLDRGALSEKAQAGVVESMSENGVWDSDDMDILMRMAPLTYVGDLCLTCGRFVARAR